MPFQEFVVIFSLITKHSGVTRMVHWVQTENLPFSMKRSEKWQQLALHVTLWNQNFVHITISLSLRLQALLTESLWISRALFHLNLWINNFWQSSMNILGFHLPPMSIYELFSSDQLSRWLIFFNRISLICSYRCRDLIFIKRTSEHSSHSGSSNFHVNIVQQMARYGQLFPLHLNRKTWIYLNGN